jgi:uncharacterized membrane protein
MSNYPPPGGYQGGYQGGGYPPPQGAGGKTKVLNLDYNVAGLLCYLPICCINWIASILFIITEPKESRLVRFHALQSLFFHIGLAILGTLVWFISVALAVGSSADQTGAAGAGAGLISLLLTLLFWGVCLIAFILDIVCMIKAYQGQMWKLPIVGNMAESKA